MYRVENCQSSLILKENRIYQGSMVLVNQRCPVRYQLSERELCPVFPDQPEIQMEEESARMLQKLLQKIQGMESITGVSGYRKKEEQIRIFENSLQENGRDFTEKYVAFPDCSEHQTGLAVDLAACSPQIDFICPEFPYEGICQTFREKAPDYGFVERYREEKQDVTGIGGEPWHFRYVGVPHAKLMQRENMALEEYVVWLKQFDLESHPLEIEEKEWRYQIGYVRAQGKITKCSIPEFERIWESGNNEDGFVITLAVRAQGNFA